MDKIKTVGELMKEYMKDKLSMKDWLKAQDELDGLIFNKINELVEGYEKIIKRLDEMDKG